MFRKLALFLLLVLVGCKQSAPITKPISPIPLAEPVPITEIPYFVTEKARPGWEERGEEFIKWNSVTVRIGGGSGTMSYYDSKNNWMYVISCGHLFSQGMGTADHYKRNPSKRTIEVFYNNEKKLSKVKSFQAEVLCHVWQNNVHDVSLMRFKPDWEHPWVAPVVPKNFVLQKGKGYHNCGCDGRSETAHYLVTFSHANMRSGVEELICTNNVARGGRSGGGLMTDDRKLFGITSRSDRTSTSYYTSYKQIHDFLTKQGFDFVLQDSSSAARQIPIIDRNGPQGDYPDDYIPLPQ